MVRVIGSPALPRIFFTASFNGRPIRLLPSMEVM